LKLSDLIKIYGFPAIIDNYDYGLLKKIIEKTKEESLKEIRPIEWWCLKFEHGKIFYYDPIKRNWENLENEN